MLIKSSTGLVAVVNYIQSSDINGSEIRIINSTSHTAEDCEYNFYFASQAIDFYGGAVYSYSRDRRKIFKTTVEGTPTILEYRYVSNYVCISTHTGMKVISHQRQQHSMHVCVANIIQMFVCHSGVSPCAINNGGCAHLCLLSSTHPKGYTCTCHCGTRLH